MKCPRCGTEFTGARCPVCGYEPSEYDRVIETLTKLKSIGRKRAEALYRAGIRDIGDLRKSDVDSLSRVEGIGRELAKKIKKEAESLPIKICPVCGAIVPSGVNVCPNCGSYIGETGEDDMDINNAIICPNCGALNPVGAKRCSICGADLSKAEPLVSPEILRDDEFESRDMINLVAEIIAGIFNLWDDIAEEYREEGREDDLRRLMRIAERWGKHISA